MRERATDRGGRAVGRGMAERTQGVGKPTAGVVRLMGNEMSEPATRSRPPAAGPKDSEDTVDGLVATFNEVRAELVSTLFFMLGNYEDAQDAAQEAFLKCW